jgi:hypothetical protein
MNFKVSQLKSLTAGEVAVDDLIYVIDSNPTDGSVKSKKVTVGDLIDSRIYGISSSQFVLITGYYADPSWISSLDWSKITNAPSFVTSLSALTDVQLSTPLSGQALVYNGTKWVNQGIGELDTLDSVTTRGNTTTNAITVGTVNVTYNNNTYLPGISITNTNSGTSSLSGVGFTVNGVLGGFMAYIPSNYVLAAQASTMQFTSVGNNKLGFIANSNQVGVAQDIYFSTFGSNATYQMQIKGNTGNIQIGTNTDAGYKLDVNGTVRIQNSSLNSLVVSAGAISGRVDSVTFTTTTNTYYGIVLTPNNANGEIRFRSSGSGTIYNEGISLNFVTSTTSTGYTGDSFSFSGGSSVVAGQGSGAIKNIFVISPTITTPNGGAGTYNILNLGGTINFSGGATGISRGIYINPTLTSVLNFIGIEVAKGKVITSSSITASSALAQGVFFNNTLVAAANNDVLVGLDINPTFTNGAFTGVDNWDLRTRGKVLVGSTSTGNVFPLVVRSANYPGILLQSASTGTNHSAAPYDGFAFWINPDVSHAKGLITNYENNGISIYNGTNPAVGLTIFGSTNNVAINTTTDAGYKLDVNGTASINGLTVGSFIRTGQINFWDQGRIGATADGTTFANSYNAASAKTLWFSGDMRFGYSTTPASIYYFGARYGGSAATYSLANFMTLGVSGLETFGATSGGSTGTILNIIPPYNYTGGTHTVRGIYYNPTLTSMTGVTHRAIETTSGDVVFNGGNVGIGVAPTNKLDIAYVASRLISFTQRPGYADYGRIQFTNVTGADIYSSGRIDLIPSNTDQSVGLGNGLTSRRLASSTNYGLHGPTPAGFLVTTNAAFAVLSANADVNTDSFVFSGPTGGRHFFKVVQNNVPYFTIMPTGNVLINTTTDAGFKLDVNGSLRVVSSVRFQNELALYSTDGINKFRIPAGTGWGTQINYGSWGSASIKFLDDPTGGLLLGTTTSTGSFSAMLDLQSNSKGLYLNRGTITTMPNLTGSGAGLAYSIISPGSGYTDGTYTNVTATGNYFGSKQVIVTVTGGIVTNVGLWSYGTKIQVGEVFTVAPGALGAGGSGFTFSVISMINANAGFTFYNTTTNSLTYWNGTNYAVPVVSLLDRVNIGSSSPADRSALLQVTSTTQGFLAPRMTTTQKNAITSPATGLEVYDSTTNTPNYFNGTTWVGVASNQSTGLSPGLFSQTSDSVAVTNTTVESSLISTGVGTLSVPANGFQVGAAYIAYLSGVMSSQNNATMEIHLRSNGFILADTDPMILSATTGKFWELHVNFVIRAIGGGGVAAIVTSGRFSYNKDSGNTPESLGFSDVNNTTFDTTINNTLTVTATWGNASLSNSIQTRIFNLYRVY